ncbi:MAG: DUF5123 domain-containing protein [Bacteroidales bacterium]
MKKTLINTGLILGVFTALFLNACKEEIDPIVEQLEFDRAFTPTGLTSQISNITTVTLTWIAAKDIDHYVVEIYQGTDFAPASLVHTADVPGGIVTYSYVLPAGDTQFSARVKAISSLSGVAESKWILADFKSGPENLFNGYESEMTGIGTCTVRWLPGSVATSLLFVSGGTQLPYTLSAGEITAGEKLVTGVPNGTYEIRLMNSTFVRGKTNILLEGDVLLAPGGDLTAALDAMRAGGVLILTNGEKYGLTEVDTVTSSIKIRGLYPDNLPVIYLPTGGGNHMFDIGTGMTLSDSLVFENVDISCYYDDAGLTRHRGVIDQELDAFAIGAIKFNNCIIRNSGRSAIRLRGNAAGQIINNVEFNNCIMYDFAFDSHYGVLNGAATGNFLNIKFINTTVYNIRGGIINYGSGAGVLSVIVDNCTFDRTSMDAASGRYFIDFGTGSNPSTGSLIISDCIFGQSSALANGVRPGTMSLTITGSYFTSDFNDGTAFPIKGSMTAYAGASTALWTDPANGIFTFLDANFAGKATAGAPRWKP